MLVERNQQLEPGVVIMEPGGLYAVPLESRTISSVDLLQLDTSPFHTAVGIRLEDNVLVTEDGRDVLNHSCPQSPWQLT